MLSYFTAIWKARHFWFSLVRLDLRTRYRRSFLGIGWSLLHPLAMTTILCVVFHKLFHQSVIDYAPHLLAGLTIWNYITSCTLQGCQSFFQGEPYLRQTPMPLAIFPLRTVLAATFHLLVGLSVVVLLVLGMGAFGLRELHILPLFHLLPGLLMLFIFCWSTAILAGLLTVYFHDVQHIGEVGFQMLFYATPIIYKAKLLEDHGLGWLMHLNPVVVFLRLIRDPLVDGVPPSLSTYAAGFAIICVTSGLAAWALHRLHRKLIFQL